MRLEPPRWWYGSSSSDRLTAALLAPAGWLYGRAAQARFALAKPYRSRLPVVCVGNFTVGGAGKTPLSLALAGLLRRMGHKPAFLTRGYGGSLVGPHRVDPERDTAADVGDEALLLASAAPTLLARDRPAGAKAIEALGASVIIMDDGFQNPSLVKDLALIAVDAGAGVGNGRVFPSGPLRAPLPFQMQRAAAAILIGDGDRDIADRLGGIVPVIKARLTPRGDVDWLRGQRVIAFSGIGRPGKFFETLRECAADLVSAEAFPDHHQFAEAEALALMAQADRQRAMLVTTEKDWVRIAGPSGPLAALKVKARALPVALVFAPAEEARLTEMLAASLPLPAGA